MADDLAGLPYCEFAVNKNGLAVDAGAQQKAADAFAASGVTDLFVVAHGWNNHMEEARALYREFFAAVRALMDCHAVPVPDRRFGVAGILWPSKKFSDQEAIPGGVSSLTHSMRLSLLARKIDGLKGVFTSPKADGALAQAKDLVPELEDNPAAREQFGLLIRSLIALEAVGGEDGTKQFAKTSGADLMRKLAVVPHSGGPAKPGGAAPFNPFSGVTAAASNLLNLTAYYQMKERAGLIGRAAAGDLVKAIVARSPRVKLHLVGHSFGARLVTALALGREGMPVQRFASMALLQAALSHNGFADKATSTGFFRDVLADHRVSGPILATCTVNDLAVGLAYPLVALIAGPSAAGPGGPTDPFGALGRNGAQNTSEAVDGQLLPVGGHYDFKGGRIFNLNADAVITGHSDICRPEVAYAVLKAVATT